MKKCKTKGCFSYAICTDSCCVKHTRAKKNKREYSRRTSPRSRLPHLEIEIECIASDDQAHSALLSQVVVPCSDASIGTLGCEFKICRESNKAIQRASRLITKLAAAGAKVDKKCGLHVHLDSRGIPLERKTAFINWIKSNQEWFFSLFPKSRQPSDNRYVQPIFQPGLDGHFVWCHTTEYNTIEIRIHGGTLNQHKLLGWLSACKDLMDILRSGVEFPAIEMLAPVTPTSRPKATTASIARVFQTPIAAEYIQARQDANGVLESFEEVSSCAD